MLDFNNELSRLYAKVKAEYESTPYVRIDYPQNVNMANWDTLVDESIVPPMAGFLYFIYDSNMELLYLGRAQRVMFALKSHLVKRTSKSTSCVLDDIKNLVINGRDKHVYIKTLEVYPREYSMCFKPLLAKEYQPKLVRRIS